MTDLLIKVFWSSKTSQQQQFSILSITGMERFVSFFFLIHYWTDYSIKVTIKGPLTLSSIKVINSITTVWVYEEGIYSAASRHLTFSIWQFKRTNLHSLSERQLNLIVLWTITETPLTKLEKHEWYSWPTQFLLNNCTFSFTRWDPCTQTITGRCALIELKKASLPNRSH